MPEAVVIGGPNGAGKTSWALRYLEPVLGIREFVNADEIARGLSPLNPDSASFAAGRLLLERVNALVEEGVSFAFETTCAGRSHKRLLERCRAKQYQITLVFLWLPSPEAAVARVARRVTEGGHRVPAEIIRRRYRAGLRNLRHLFMPLADRYLVYDNSDASGHLILERRADAAIIVHDPERWNLIEKVGL